MNHTKVSFHGIVSCMPVDYVHTYMYNTYLKYLHIHHTYIYVYIYMPIHSCDLLCIYNIHILYTPQSFELDAARDASIFFKTLRPSCDSFTSPWKHEKASVFQLASPSNMYVYIYISCIYIYIYVNHLIYIHLCIYFYHLIYIHTYYIIYIYTYYHSYHY